MIGVVNKFKVLCRIGNMYISYHKGFLYKQYGLTADHIVMVPLPSSSKNRIFQKIRILERLLRLEPRIAIPLNSEEILLSYQGSLYRINCISNKVTKDHKLRRNMNNPLSFCVNGDTVLYGEYFTNDQREEVSIYQRVNNEWAKVFSFNAGEVLHIHQLVFDKFRNCYWIQTGDSDSESGIWQADLAFEHVKPVFRGKQMFRSCFLTPMKNHLVYATDTPLEQNYIYVIEEISPGLWGKPQVVSELPGPCIFGKIIDDSRIAIATSVEPDPRLSMFRYRITNKLGPGVKDQYSHIFIGSPLIGFKEIFKGKKDVFPMNLFQFGNYQFPYINDSEYLYVTGQSIKGQDGRTCAIEIV